MDIAPVGRAGLSYRGLWVERRAIVLRDIGHFDLLFTVIYSAVMASVFTTASRSTQLRSFEFFMPLTLLIVVVDPWVLHNRNRYLIENYPYFSLVSILLVLFFYANINNMLADGEAQRMGSKFWIWVILLFSASFFMKRHYEDKVFYRLWDVLAIAVCLLYIWGMRSRNWDNSIALGAASFLIAVLYLLIEWQYHNRCAKTH